MSFNSASMNLIDGIHHMAQQQTNNFLEYSTKENKKLEKKLEYNSDKQPKKNVLHKSKTQTNQGHVYTNGYGAGSILMISIAVSALAILGAFLVHPAAGVSLAVVLVPTLGTIAIFYLFFTIFFQTVQQLDNNNNF